MNDSNVSLRVADRLRLQQKAELGDGERSVRRTERLKSMSLPTSVSIPYRVCSPTVGWLHYYFFARDSYCGWNPTTTTEAGGLQSIPFPLPRFCSFTRHKHFSPWFDPNVHFGLDIYCMTVCIYIYICMHRQMHIAYWGNSQVQDCLKGGSFLSINFVSPVDSKRHLTQDQANKLKEAEEEIKRQQNEAGKWCSSTCRGSGHLPEMHVASKAI